MDTTNALPQALIAATLAGDLHFIRENLPDLTMPGQDVPTPEEDDYAFLGPDPSNLSKPLVETVKDTRGLNLADLICEAAVLARAKGERPSHLSGVTLELLVKKGAMVSNAGLKVLFLPKDYEAFGPFAREVQHFRRTIGLFGLAVFGFESLGQARVLSSQAWSVRRLYGVASVIHGDMLSSNIAGICRTMSPAFLELLQRENGESALHRFAARLAQNAAMMNSIRDNHAHRFLTTYLKTPSFEREVLHHAHSHTPVPTLDPLKLLIRRTILFADDQETHRLKTIASLIAQGFAVIEARDGLEALALHERNSGEVDLVVSDFGMPEMDGFNMAIQLRLKDPQLPIIINTSPPIHPDLRSEANRLGVSLIPKYDEALLFQTIQEVLALDECSEMDATW